ncbi:hypothetical protein OB13_07740 [Pontibacter sp. HJ8]
MQPKGLCKQRYNQYTNGTRFIKKTDAGRLFCCRLKVIEIKRFLLHPYSVFEEQNKHLIFNERNLYLVGIVFLMLRIATASDANFTRPAALFDVANVLYLCQKAEILPFIDDRRYRTYLIVYRF